MASVFHAYDVRGLIGNDLNEDLFYRIGRALVHFLNVEKIMVGRDMRETSPGLQAALIRGITDQGADVVDIGLCSSSMFYWAAQRFPASAMVTASHNPAQYNGCKFCRDGAGPMGEGNGLRDIERLTNENAFPTVERKGVVTSEEIFEPFLQFTTSFFHAKRPFRVVIDAANGMGGYTYGGLIGRLPNVEIIPMYFELDGTFPNHEANPLKVETLDALKRRVIEEKADLGVAIDGDEDRVVFVDEKGMDLPSDITTAILARQVLKEHPGSKILYDIRQSRVAPEEIASAGGVPVMTRVGHSFIKAAMREHNGAWGGELSGHFYNREVQNAECTQLTFFQMLNLLDRENCSLHTIAEPLRQRYAKIPETNFKVADPKMLIAMMEERYAHRPDVRSITAIDGIRVDFDDWWFNLRASNTEPLLRLNLEAKTPQMRDAFFAELSADLH